MACDTNNCKEFIMQNRQKFGITENTLKTECLDICAHNVRYIASRRINEKITLPSMSQFINSCTGLVDTACGIDTQFASLRITHAKEQLVNCDTPNPGVQVTIKGQVIVRTKPVNCHCPPSYMAIPVELVSEVIYDYYSTENGEKVHCLANVLPMVDGSCMVINLSCRIYREVCGGCSRYVAHIKGSVVDKLWKTENIWVEGIRPYTAPSITVCDVFERISAKAVGTMYVWMPSQWWRKLTLALQPAPDLTVAAVMYAVETAAITAGFVTAIMERVAIMVSVALTAITVAVNKN